MLSRLGNGARFAVGLVTLFAAVALVTTTGSPQAQETADTSALIASLQARLASLDPQVRVPQGPQRHLRRRRSAIRAARIGTTRSWCASAFWPEATISFGTPMSRDEYVDWEEGVLAGYAAHQHHVTGQTIEIAGDTAHVESYVVYFLVPRDRGADVAGPATLGRALTSEKTRLGSGRYVERWERRNGDWKILVREYVEDLALLGDTVDLCTTGGASAAGTARICRTCGRSSSRRRSNARRAATRTASRATRRGRAAAMNRLLVGRRVVLLVGAGAYSLLGGASARDRRRATPPTSRRSSARCSARRAWRRTWRAWPRIEAIWENELEYTRGLDRHDEALERAVFWPDAAISYGTSVPYDELAPWANASHANSAAHQHHVTGLTLDVDGETAHEEGYILYLVGYARETSRSTRAGVPTPGRVVAESTATLGTGRYVNRYERRDGDWRMIVHEYVNDISMRLQAVDLCATACLGRWDPSDISYARPLQPLTTRRTARPEPSRQDTACGAERCGSQSMKNRTIGARLRKVMEKPQ